MKVIILARTKDEAETHRKWAKLSRQDAISVSSSRALDGLLLHDEDLIVELPSFREHREHRQICDTLSRSMLKSGEVPRWEKITG